MKTEEPKSDTTPSNAIETFGGDYHRLESTFRPNEKKLAPRPRGRKKQPTRPKPARKTTE